MGSAIGTPHNRSNFKLTSLAQTKTFMTADDIIHQGLDRSPGGEHGPG